MLDDCDLIMKNSEREHKDVVLFTLTEGAIFGDEDVVGLKKRSYKAICNSIHGEIYLITKPEIDRRLWW